MTIDELRRNGWRFNYDDAIGFVEAKQKNRGKFPVCEVVTTTHTRKIIGAAIAAMLNGECVNERRNGPEPTRKG